MKNISMTDNLYEFRKFILKDLVEMGYKYIARYKEGAIYAYSHKPARIGTAWILERDSNDDKLKDISLVSALFTDIEWKNEEPFRIPYTNWKEVPVDAPVVYIGESGKNYVRYFCKYDDKSDRVVLYANGRTSLTEHGIFETYPERVSIYEQGEKLDDVD